MHNIAQGAPKQSRAKTGPGPEEKLEQGGKMLQ